jgi:hypothetical protein
MPDPHNHGYKQWRPAVKFEGISDRTLEMLKIAALLAFASWMTLCIMLIVFSREIAEFIVERNLL